MTRLYGIASRISGDVAGWSGTREEAEAKLAGVLRDAAELAGELWVELVELRRPVPVT